jgi:hypothetical protein
VKRDCVTILNTMQALRTFPQSPRASGMGSPISLGTPRKLRGPDRQQAPASGAFPFPDDDISPTRAHRGASVHERPVSLLRRGAGADAVHSRSHSLGVGSPPETSWDGSGACGSCWLCVGQVVRRAGCASGRW